MSNANTLERPSASAGQLAAELKELISLPDVYLRLQQVMRSDEASMDKVAEVLTLDPALVARLLRIANNALYSFPSRVDTVSRAVNILGVRQVHDLVLATSVAKAFAGMDNAVLDMRTFWYRSVQCGILARTLAEGAGMKGGESLFVRGLLYDLGHLVLYHHYPEQCRAALAESGGEYGALTQAERRIMQHHAIAGYVLLSYYLQDSQHTTSIVARDHHERKDGSGYPYGLQGDDILLEARVIGVADVIEAMASHRPYRPALGIDDASEELTTTSGIINDPEVVNVAGALFTKQGDTRQ